MNIDSHCTFKIHEFAAFEGWYWEITVPGKIHPEKRIKEFTLDDSGLGRSVRLNPVGSINAFPFRDGINIYRGVITDKLIADSIASSIFSEGTNRVAMFYD